MVLVEPQLMEDLQDMEDNREVIPAGMHHMERGQVLAQCQEEDMEQRVMERLGILVAVTVVLLEVILDHMERDQPLLALLQAEDTEYQTSEHLDILVEDMVDLLEAILVLMGHTGGDRVLIKLQGEDME